MTAKHVINEINQALICDGLEIKKDREEGREEGRKEGRKEGREGGREGGTSSLP